MSKPTQKGFESVKRIGRYLKGAPRLVQHFDWEAGDDYLHGYADSDWAGDRVAAKSTSGGVITYGNHVLKTWSSTQSIVALSSGEAELYALTKATAQTFGIIQMAMDFEMTLEAKIHTDSTAAIGIVHRSGLGRTRHIQVQFLWIQECISEGRVSVNKIDTKLNPADLLTKHLNAELRASHISRLCMEIKFGKAEAGKNLRLVESRSTPGIARCAGLICERVYSISNSSGCQENRSLSDIWIERGGCTVWERKHLKARQALFTPMKVAGGPSVSTCVGKYRVTIGLDEHLNNFYAVDLWKDLKDPHARCVKFTGRTVFVDNLEDATKLIVHSMGG